MIQLKGSLWYCLLRRYTSSSSWWAAPGTSCWTPPLCRLPLAVSAVVSGGVYGQQQQLARPRGQARHGSGQVRHAAVSKVPDFFVEDKVVKNRLIEKSVVSIEVWQES